MLCWHSVCEMKVSFDQLLIQCVFLYFRAVTMELLSSQPSKETCMISARTLWGLCWDAITTGKWPVSWEISPTVYIKENPASFQLLSCSQVVWVWWNPTSVTQLSFTSEYMTDRITELRRKIWRHDWSSQLYTQLSSCEIKAYLTIIRRRRSEHRWIFTETKSRLIFTNVHWAWGE